MIKQIVQTSKNNLSSNELNLLLSSFPGWSYKHFSDKKCLKYMNNNKILGFDNPCEIFLRLKRGAHKADLFRYYFIYLNGGLYLDTDLCVYSNIERYLNDFSFVSVQSSIYPGCIYQGFLYSKPRNELLHNALCLFKDYDSIIIDKLNNGDSYDYQIIIRDLHNILLDQKNNKDILLLQESKLINYTSPIDGKQHSAIRIGYEEDWFGVHWQSERILHPKTILEL